MQGSSFSAGVDAELGRGTARLQASRLLGPQRRSSPRRRSAASAGSRTPPCSRVSGSTASAATTSSSRAIGSRSAARSSGPAGVPSPTCPSNDRTWPEGTLVLPLRQALRPAQRGLSRTEVRVRVHARPVRVPGPAAPRARQAAPPAPLRRGRPRVEPRAVDADPPADRLERGRRRLDLQASAGVQREPLAALRRPSQRACGVRPVHPVHA